MNKNEDERISALFTSNEYRQKHNRHTEHIIQLFSSINEISKYLPQLKTGMLQREFSFSKEEEKVFLKTENATLANTFFTRFKHYIREIICGE